MLDNWSFGRKITVGFAAIVALALLMAVFAIHTLRDVVRTHESLTEIYQRSLNDSLRLDAQVENHIAASRAYLLTQQQSYLDDKTRVAAEIDQLLGRMRQATTASADLSGIERAWSEYVPASQKQQQFAVLPSNSEPMRAALEELRPFRQRLRIAVDQLVNTQERQIERTSAATASQVTSSTTLLAVTSIVGTLLAALLATVLARLLNRQIGTAVAQIQSSSAELQAAAGQQATGLREQATAMAEVTTTINELLATSRQIAESSKQVAHQAMETANGAKLGTAAVEQSKAALTSISKQVDQVVTYMVELGRKSQQIGLILDLVSELAEQTNILAINATIEATGAGEAGRRFLVVADEIRKLADRVTGSTKEVRSQIEDVRAAVSTTVMATEMGAKAVETGSRQFEELSRVFVHIAALVRSTTDAAREIELSTKQQASAVEQVNIAVSSIAQATREGEASSTQTLQTAAQLTALSKDLVRVVSAGAVA